ncbi:MAG: hypothetical protein IJW65_00205 [Clostridia bacterium]|nr:hypothetical protein [Clostridia bacterium]
MDNLFKILGVAILCACVGVVLRSAGNNFGDVAKIVFAALLSGVVIISASPLIELIFNICEGSQVNTYMSVMLKALGVSFVTHICVSVCRDVGEQTVASYAELAGKIEMLIISVPLIEEIIGIAEGLVEMI